MIKSHYFSLNSSLSKSNPGPQSISTPSICVNLRDKIGGLFLKHSVYVWQRIKFQKYSYSNFYFLEIYTLIFLSFSTSPKIFLIWIWIFLKFSFQTYVSNIPWEIFGRVKRISPLQGLDQRKGETTRKE